MMKHLDTLGIYEENIRGSGYRRFNHHGFGAGWKDAAIGEHSAKDPLSLLNGRGLFN